MDSEIFQDRNWFKRNWKWFVPVILLSILFIVVFSLSGSKNHMSNFVLAYADTPLYENAVKKSNANKEVQSVLGKLEPVDELAILESNVEYGDNNKSVNLSVRVHGNKGTGKMDVLATRKGKGWKYKNIKIRIKQPKQEIVVLQ